jgi:hypothetical protein
VRAEEFRNAADCAALGAVRRRVGDVFFPIHLLTLLAACRSCQDCMKKEHRFTVVVKTDMSRTHAERALLVSFAWRDPDRCEFHLRKSAPKTKGGAK